MKCDLCEEEVDKASLWNAYPPDFVFLFCDKCEQQPKVCWELIHRRLVQKQLTNGADDL